MPTGRVPATGQILSTAAPTGHAGPSRLPEAWVNKIASDGWLEARSETTHLLVPLAKYTGVQVTGVVNGRTIFKVMDGPRKGSVLSLTEANAKIYLGSKAPSRTPAELQVSYGKYVAGWHSAARNQDLDQQMATLTVGAIHARVTMNTNWGGSFFPLPPGDYDVLVPDAPHNANMTRYYRQASPKLIYDQVWFPIRFGDNSRYVHIGNISDGCVTVIDMDLWGDIHEALISHRSADGNSVAKLVVGGKPERAR